MKYIQHHSIESIIRSILCGKLRQVEMKGKMEENV